MDLFEDALERTRLRYLFVVAGYVVMPEHVHLLINEPRYALLFGANRTVMPMPLAQPREMREIQMLEVKKIAEDLYIAIATPPEVDEEWFTPKALSAHQLIKELSNRGAHSTDIGDAMYQQDPAWLEKAQGPYE
ncbi:hypothetical protein ACFPT7_18620 [Acidicapsa dinghuensis]|uniref:Transposase IS200-like domain-containing protein n=1 Tax=Acidicapsa dinghuensis TaxID=2218256 RepID=A0ABW1EM16_9BACT|nr:hypothetical protein [Acidicapsa dinghuensis]